jgi:hypothetical protein
VYGGVVALCHVLSFALHSLCVSSHMTNIRNFVELVFHRLFITDLVMSWHYYLGTVSSCLPVAVTERPKAWTVFARWDAVIVGLNRTFGLDVLCVYVFSLCLVCVCAVLCLGRADDSSKKSYRSWIDQETEKSRISENVGASSSRNPKGLHGLYGDNFTFTFIN